MKKKKKGMDSQSTAELLQKLQAAVLSSSHKHEKKEEPLDRDELDFQKKIAGMLNRVTADSEQADRSESSSKGSRSTETKQEKTKKNKDPRSISRKDPTVLESSHGEPLAEAFSEPEPPDLESPVPETNAFKKSAEEMHAEAPLEPMPEPTVTEVAVTEQTEKPKKSAKTKQNKRNAVGKRKEILAESETLKTETTVTEAKAEAPKAKADATKVKPIISDVNAEKAQVDLPNNLSEVVAPAMPVADTAYDELPTAAEAAPVAKSPNELHPAKAAPALERPSKPNTVRTAPASKMQKHSSTVTEETASEMPGIPSTVKAIPSSEVLSKPHADKMILSKKADPSTSERRAPVGIAPAFAEQEGVPAPSTKAPLKKPLVRIRGEVPHAQPSVTPPTHMSAPLPTEAPASGEPLSSRMRLISAEMKPRDAENAASTASKQAIATPEQKEIMQKKKEQTVAEKPTPANSTIHTAPPSEPKEEPIVVRPKSAPAPGEPIVIKPRQSTRTPEPTKLEKPAATETRTRITPPTAAAPEQKAKIPVSEASRGTAVPKSATLPKAAAATAPQSTASAASSPKNASAKQIAQTNHATDAHIPHGIKAKAAKKKAPSAKHTPIAHTDQDEALDEALDEVITAEPLPREMLSAEETPVEEPEQISAPEKKNIFSRRREKKRRDAESQSNAAAIIEQKTGMTEDEIAMIFELGYENELGRLVGYETLKKLKFEHIRNHRSDKRIYRTSYGYRGTEYTGSQNKNAVFGAYMHDRKMLLVRLILSAILTLTLIPCELHGLFGGLLAPTASAYPFFFPAVSLILLTALALLHHKNLYAGLRSFFRFSPTPYSLNAVLLPIALAYGIFSLACGLVGAGIPTPIGIPVSLSLILTDVCDAFRLTGEMRSFRIVSAKGEKTVLDKTEPRKKKLRQGDKIVKIINDDIDQSFYRVRQSEETSGFFRRVNDFSSTHRPFMILIVLMLSLAFLSGLAGAVRTGSAVGGLSYAATALLFALPCTSLALFFYSLSEANHCLSHHNCTLVGEESVSEYGEPKTVIFQDSDMYAAQKCTQLSVREGEDFRRDMLLAGALFRKMSGTLGAVGDHAPAKSEEPSVAFVRMTDHGTEALVDNQYHLLAGNAEFMTRSGVRVPKESSDRALRRGKNVSLMYVAIDGALKLGYEIEYTVYHDFEDLVFLLGSIDATTAAIQTYDPNLNDAFLFASRHDGADYVRVIKPGRYEQEGALEVSDTGAVALGNKFDIALPLIAASSVRDIRRRGLRAQILLSVLASLSVTAICAATGTYLTGLAALLPVLWQLGCIAVSGVLSHLKLHRELE